MKRRCINQAYGTAGYFCKFLRRYLTGCGTDLLKKAPASRMDMRIADVSLKGEFMERFTISLDENLATAFDALIKERGYATRSEAVRDILRSHYRSVSRSATRRARALRPYRTSTIITNANYPSD